MTITFCQTAVDHLQLYWMTYRSRPLATTLMLGGTIAFVWFLSVRAILNEVQANEPISPWTIAIPLLLPFILIGVQIGVALWLYHSSPALRGERTYEFLEERIEFRSMGQRAAYEWKALTLCFISRNGILFCSGQLPLIHLPARAVTPDIAAQLRRLVESHRVPTKGTWDQG